jgi:mono/diheme cytochrome c family protein
VTGIFANRWLRRGLIGAGGVALVGAALVGTGVALAHYKRLRHVPVAVAPVRLPEDAASLRRGKYLFESRGCAECHGVDGSGRIFARDEHGLLLRAPNITRGAGGVIDGYRGEDWVRTIRHGVKPDGRPVFVMPSEDYARLTDADVASIGAYARQFPPVAGSGPIFDLPVILTALYGFGVVLDAAAKIDHALAPPAPVPEAVSVEHGQYVASMCIGCHGQHLSGGKLAGHPPAWPPAANLTPGEGTALTRYPDAEAFIAMLRTGKRPDGSAIDRAMPFATLGALSDVDAKALYAYLTSLPPRPAGGG